MDQQRSDPTDSRPMVAAALSTTIGLASMRVLIPEIYRLREDAGLAVAAGVALLTFASPLVAGAIRRMLGSRRAVVAVLVAQALAWVALQALHPIPSPVAAAATGLALIGWTLLLHAMRSASPGNGAAFTLAFVLGLTLDAAIHAAFRTWDVSWQDSASAAATTVALAAALIVAAFRAGSTFSVPAEAAWTRSLPLAGLGLSLVLSALFLQNVAFVDSVTGLSILGGAVVVLVADLAAVAGLIWGRAFDRRTAPVVAAIVLVAAAWCLTSGTSWLVVLSVALGSVATAQLVAASLSVDVGEAHASAWRTSIAVAIGTVAFALCALLYQIHITNPLPVSNRWIPVIGAALLGVTGSLRVSTRERQPARAILVPVALLLATPLLLALTAPDPLALPAEGVTLMMDWNVHSAIDADGMLDPHTVGAEILRQNASIVVLQEVPRGWMIAGTVDLAGWLANQTQMSMAWAPAADGQFGNLILSREPITSSEVIPLPYGAGPQHRSALRVETRTWDGAFLTVVGTHLESKAGTSTGADQVRTILDQLSATSPAILAGDMNMQPDNPDLQLFADAGFVSAQDVTGHGSETTSRDPTSPTDRVDWIFGKGVTFGGFEIVASPASDHLPLVTGLGT